MPIDCESRVRQVRLKHSLDRVLRCLQFGHGSFPKSGCKSSSQHERVSVPKRDIQVFCEARDHLATRLGSTCLETGQMSGGAFCGQRKIGLGHTSSLAPTAQERAEREGMDGHRTSLAPDGQTRQKLPFLTCEVMDFLSGTPEFGRSICHSLERKTVHNYFGAIGDKERPFYS